MKRLRTIVCALVLVAAAGFLAGCVTDEDAGLSPNPWNQPQGWEGPLPSSINQGR
jgi:heme A synthase